MTHRPSGEVAREARRWPRARWRFVPAGLLVLGLAALAVHVPVGSRAQADGFLLAGGLPARIAGSAVASVGPLQATDHLAHLPLGLRHLDLASPPLPTVSLPTPTPPAPTRTPTAAASPTITPTRVPLALRIETREVDVDGRIAQPMGPWTTFPILTALRYDGSQLVGWSSTDGRVHVTPLGRDGAREGPDIAFAGASIHGLVAHAGGGAALYVLGDEMRLRRFEDGGAVVFEKTLVGTESHGREGAKWIDDWSHEGRLVWTGETYAAYFGHTQNWGSNGKHQGDLLWLFDGDGNQITGAAIPSQYDAWNWGCSHSVDVRLAYNAGSDALGPVCLSDEFPTDGAVFARSRLVADMPGDGGGHVQGELGGLAWTETGFTLTFVSRTDRASYDVGFARLGPHGDPTHVAWLTDSPRLDETSAHLARYGDGLLAAWRAGGALLLSVLDLDGNLVDGPVEIDADIGLRDDFVGYDDGRAGWTHAGPGRSSLIGVVVAAP